MSGIDYSKWDHIDVSESEDEEEVGTAPRVTRLDQPSRVTRTPEGNLLVEPTNTKSSPLSLNKKPSLTSSVPSSWIEKGGKCSLPDNMQLYWCQDRSSVVLRFPLDTSSTLGWDCQISSPLPFEDRQVATLAHSGQILTIRQHERIFLRDEIRYPVHLAQGEDSLDWSIERHGSEPILVITLYKATPMAGLTLWWKSPLVSCPEITLDWLDNSTFANVWDQAHQEFREKFEK